MKKKLSIGLALCMLGLIFTLTALAIGSDNVRNIKFLKSYGWEVERTPLETCEITIPPAFDEVYANYNILQKEAGLDLAPYLGMDAVRYTYRLTNFPYETDSEVRANVVTVDGTPVAGDIMTVELGGFMYSLNFNEAVCFRLK